MPLSQSHIQLKEPARAALGDAVAAFYARQRGEPEPEQRPFPPTEQQTSPASAGRMGACRARRDSKADAIRALAAKNHSATSISTELRMGTETVRRIAAENGITLRATLGSKAQSKTMLDGRVRRAKAAEQRRQAAAPRVAELAAQGFTLKRIAETMGATAKWIARIAKEHNITPTPQGSTA